MAKGFHQTPRIDFSETFSPVVKPQAVRAILSIVISRGWDIQQVDMNNDFLNGNLEKNVYMTQPSGFEDMARPQHVCKLKKALYGLKQAPRAWFERLRSALVQ